MGQGGFDRVAVEREYRRLVETGGRLDLDRVPNREDIHARWHWKFERVLMKDGCDPARFDCGRHSYMISGRGRPQLKRDKPRLEYRFRYDPMPLAWFDNPYGRMVFRDADPEHRLLELLCGKHLAGWQDRPTGAEMYRILVEGAWNDDDRLMARELLCDIRHEFYPQLRRRDALSIWHIARAAHDCEVRRGRLSWWLNQFAEKPAGWDGSAHPSMFV